VPIAAARHRGPSLALPDGRSAAVTLLFPARAAVIVGGVPGAGKTTLLERVATQGGACVLDSAAVRVRLRKRLGPRVPYALFRPLVHVLHQLAVWRALGSDGSDAVVVHDCATRRWLRRLMLWRAHRGRRPVVLLALDTDAGQARAGQRARERRVRDAVMRRHERHWSELLGADDGRAPGERLRLEGFTRVHVLDRSAADAVTALRFARPTVRIRSWPQATTTTGSAPRPRGVTAAIAPSPSSGATSVRSSPRRSASPSSCS
jgi:predicted kinase